MYVDPAAVDHAVGNLIDNAIKWSPPGAAVRVVVEDSPALLFLRPDFCEPCIYGGGTRRARNRSDRGGLAPLLDEASQLLPSLQAALGVDVA